MVVARAADQIGAFTNNLIVLTASMGQAHLSLGDLVEIVSTEITLMQNLSNGLLSNAIS